MQPLVLCYHRISYPNKYDLSKLAINPEVFRSQLLYLKKRYEFVDLKFLVANKPKNSIAITFDDGSKDWLTFAAPILTELSIPATFFVSTQFVEDSFIFLPISLGKIYMNFSNNELKEFLSNFDLPKNADYFSLLNLLNARSPSNYWEIVKYLSDSVQKLEVVESNELPLDIEDLISLNNSNLFELGLHSAIHKRFTNMSPAELEKDFMLSIESFNRWNISYSKFFPIPFGQKSDFNDEQAKFISSYLNLLPMSTRLSPFKNHFVIPRISVQNWEPIYLNRVINYANIFSYAPFALDFSMNIRRKTLSASNRNIFKNS